MDKQLTDIVRGYVRAVEGEMVDQIVDRIASALQGKSSPSKRLPPFPETAKVRSPKQDGRTKRDMRCRYVPADGQRCAARSKGPRFKFLCVEHVGLPLPSLPQEAAVAAPPAPAPRGRRKRNNGVLPEQT